MMNIVQNLHLQQVMYFVLALLIIAAFIWSGNYMFLKLYKSSIRKSKAAHEYPDISIPAEISSLIYNFDQQLGIRISTDPAHIPTAVSYGHKPAYIILPKNYFEHHSPDEHSFSIGELLAIVAHELGHIISQSHRIWLKKRLVSSLIASIIACFIAFVGKYWIASLYTILSIAFFWFWLCYVRRMEEYSADSFAIEKVKIPVSDFANALIKFELTHKPRQSEKICHLALIKDSLQGFVDNSYPRVEQRIERIRILYSA